LLRNKWFTLLRNRWFTLLRNRWFTLLRNTHSLLEIHHYLFQDVYEWAGKVRIVNISKNGKQFFDGERFNMGFQYIDTLITEYSVLNKKNRKEIASKKETEEHKENF